jgi:hypothetical protein
MVLPNLPDHNKGEKQVKRKCLDFLVGSWGFLEQTQKKWVGAFFS